MRIVSGKLKGRQIPVRKNFSARPTTDFAKESLFNILNNYFDFDDTTVLDLFAGTGSISYEFASRGCKKIVAVEKEYRSYDFIRQTTRNLNLGSIQVVKVDAFSFIEKCTESFEIVFADPPYQMTNLKEIPDLVLRGNVLKPGGWFVLEHGSDNNFNGHNGFREMRNYGGVHFSIFVKE
ncbi:MAG: RsmD family RNA methyltransferase [Bacteroidales bacterium]|nr:RsmD family RNA methyltransferase [Bacteroidales bacterium]